jgi:hypothetical protein
VNLKTAAVLFGFLAPLSAGAGSAADMAPNHLKSRQATSSAEAKTENGSRLTKQQNRLPRKQLTKFTA